MKKKIVFILVLLVVSMLLSSCGIRHEDARQRFAELAGTNVSQVVIIRHSSSNWWVGDPWDVTYELKINDIPMSGRCFYHMFAGRSTMVCRLYSQGDE